LPPVAFFFLPQSAVGTLGLDPYQPPTESPFFFFFLFFSFFRKLGPFQIPRMFFLPDVLTLYRIIFGVSLWHFFYFPFLNPFAPQRTSSPSFSGRISPTSVQWILAPPVALGSMDLDLASFFFFPPWFFVPSSTPPFPMCRAPCLQRCPLCQRNCPICCSNLFPRSCYFFLPVFFSLTAEDKPF